MTFVIQGIDTSGSISLRRDTTAAAVKKAAELIEDGCLDVQITTPDGRVYASTEFDRLRIDAKTWMDRPDDDEAATPPVQGVQGIFPTILPSVSFMITLGQKDRLRQLGYDDTAISAMTPQDAHRILRLAWYEVARLRKSDGWRS